MKVRYRFREIEGSRGASAKVGDDGGDALVEAKPGQDLLAAALQVSQGEPECRCFRSLWGCEEFQVALYVSSIQETEHPLERTARCRYLV